MYPSSQAASAQVKHVNQLVLLPYRQYTTLPCENTLSTTAPTSELKQHTGMKGTSGTVSHVPDGCERAHRQRLI